MRRLRVKGVAEGVTEEVHGEQRQHPQLAPAKEKYGQEEEKDPS